MQLKYTSTSQFTGVPYFTKFRVLLGGKTWVVQKVRTARGTENRKRKNKGDESLNVEKKKC